MDKRLTARDITRYTRYNEILTICKAPMTHMAIADVMNGMSVPTIKNDMIMLAAMGYVKAEAGRVGRFNQKTTFYTALKLSFAMSDLIPSNVYTQRLQSLKDKKPLQVKDETNPHAKVHRLMDDAEHFAKQNMCRNKAKSVYGISGSSLSMF